MKKNQIIIGIAVLTILVIFGIRSYNVTQGQVKSQQEKLKNNPVNSPENNRTTTNKKSLDRNQKIFKWRSELYDIERPDGSMITKREITYHTFDFQNKTVTQSSRLNGQEVTMVYPFYEIYEEKGVLASTSVLVVNTLGVKEIWFSAEVPNLGYDYDDGTRIACYDLSSDD